MTKSKEQIIDSIDAFIEIRDGDYEEWYIGITDNPDRRLFDEHKVDKKCKNHFYRETSSNDIARYIEQYFLALGCNGGAGGGEKDSVWVYGYIMTSRTKP